jgi:type IV pilus assembly protein PilB
MKLRIGELLSKYGIITKTQLEEALELQKKEKNRKLGEILIKLEYLKSEDLIWMLSEQADIPFVEVRPEMLDRELINIYPESLLYADCVLPLYETDDKIFIALGDPMNAKAIQDIKQYTNKEIVASGADPKKIEQVLNRFFLSEQLDRTAQSDKSGKTITKITAANALIEITDESGEKTTKEASIEIIIKTPEDEGDDK